MQLTKNKGMLIDCKGKGLAAKVNFYGEMRKMLIKREKQKRGPERLNTRIYLLARIHINVYILRH